MSYLVQQIKQAAHGRWRSILTLPLHRDDNGGQPCPKCNGTDRFNIDREFDDNGKVFCRHCLPQGSGDGIGTFAWFNGIENSEAIKQLASELGVSTETTDAPKRDLLEEVCIDKHMPLDAFKLFEPTLAKRGKQNVVRIPVWNSKGNKESHFDLWPGDKGKLPRGGTAGLFLPGRLPQPGELWLLVEGVKDASALIGLGYPNVCGLPTNVIGAAYGSLFKGCDVIVVPDNDTAGHWGAQKTGSYLVGIAASVRIARLPGEVVEKGGQDTRDVLRQRGADAVKRAIEESKAWTPTESEPSKDTRPEVLLLLNEAYVSDQVVKHLGNLGWASDWIPKFIREKCKVFVRGGALVHIVESEDPETRGRLKICEMPGAIVRERITQCCQLQTEGVDKDGNVVLKPERPPKWLVDSIVNRGQYSGKVRSLTAIIQTPTLRSDGSIIQSAGWDESTGMLYHPNDKYPTIPDKPTKEDAIAAWESIQEVITDFPFVNDSDRTAWFAFLLSLVARPCINGCIPLFAITATTAGSGKGLLADAATLLAYGHGVSKKGFPLKEEELAKQITSLLIEGAPCHVFDNVDRTLRGAELDALLTATTWKDRILGESKTTGDIPAKTIWIATGNNLQFGTDTARRVLPIRLEPATETPEARTDFRHSDLLQWIRENRPRLVVDALTFVRAYFVAGCPRPDSEGWGSFESWTATIRGSIVWAGLADPLSTRSSVAESDETKDSVRRLIGAIEEADPQGKGKTVRELFDLLKSYPDQVPLLVDVVTEICGGSPIPKRFSKRLISVKGRIVDGKRIESENAGGGIKRWKVTGGGLGGLGGFDTAEVYTRTEIEPIGLEEGQNAYTYTGQVKSNPLNQPNQPYTVSTDRRVSGVV
ncbi:primase-helicase zinc-binding domain-containing protein [Pirellulaceae bacterium SH467]